MMPAKRPAGREVTCREGHPFTTAARPGSTVRCPARAAGGERCGVPVYVPKTPAPGPAEADPWADVPAFDPDAAMTFPPAAEPCPECGGDALTTPRETMVYCPQCPHAEPPAWVRDRAARSAERAARSAEVAVRVDAAAELRERLALAERRAETAEACRRWADMLDLDDDDGGPAVLSDSDAADAWRYSVRLAELATAAERAADTEALDVVRQVAAETAEAASPVLDRVRAARARERERAARQAEAQRRAAEYAAAERERQAAAERERQAAAERERAERQAAARRVIPGEVVRPGQVARPARRQALPAPPRSDPYAQTAATVSALMDERKRRAGMAERHGYCRFPGNHPLSVGLLGNKPPPAERWVTGNNTGVAGHQTPGAPVVNICTSQKCLDSAEAWLKSQGWRDATYGGLE